LKNNSASKQTRRKLSAASSMVTWQHRGGSVQLAA